MTDLSARVPPHDLNAEAAVLASAILDQGAIDLVSATLRPEHFYSEANRRIYEAAVTLSLGGIAVDVVSVASQLRATDRLQQVGGTTYLAQLVDAVPAVSHIETYAKTIVELWRLRELIRTCETIKAEAFGPVGNIQEFLDRSEHDVYRIAHTGATSTRRVAGAIIRDVFARIKANADQGKRIAGTPTGFERLDRMMCGLIDGELTIVAARPGIGKTSIAMNMAINVAAPVNEGETQIGVAVFSLEMPQEQLAMRLVCSEGRVDLGRMRQGVLHDRDWDNLTQAAGFIYQLPLWIDDKPAINLLELRASVRQMQAEYNKERSDGTYERRIGLVVIDYLQLMRGVERIPSREQEIAEISRGLKQMAKELKVPVMALAQLNRELEKRSDKRPQLSDLRDSGAIEQDADNIIFLYRDEYYDPESEAKGIAELIIGKQRNGPTGTVKVRFDGPFTRFDNLAPGEHENG